MTRSGILAFLICLVALPAGAGELVVKRVMLSAGGVAYLEREAEVEGDAELFLDVPLDQVDDVLKSIVVYDSAGGVGSAHLPGREPVAQIFTDLPFGADALASPEALLNALQGSEVRIGGGHAVEGKLLKVVTETVRLNDQSTIQRHRVSVMTPAGLQQVVLEEADSVAFTDAALQAKVERALAAIAEHHAKDRRRIVLSARGQGKRVLRVGYVVAAPLWKSTYRLILPPDATKTTAHLQGWAVLENMSGEDWQNVELTVFSGHPVSFRQALYQAYYVDRPEVPVEVAGRILPRTDSGVVVAGNAGGVGSNSGPRALSVRAGAGSAPRCFILGEGGGRAGRTRFDTSACWRRRHRDGGRKHDASRVPHSCADQHQERRVLDRGNRRPRPPGAAPRALSARHGGRSSAGGDRPQE